MKDTKMLLIIGVVLILLVGGGLFVLSSNKSGSNAETTEEESTEIEQEQILTLKPEEIGLEVSVRADKKAVKFVINKPDGITAVEYEIKYEAEGGIPRGAIGQVTPEEGASTIESKFIDLGSCSSGKCKYDTGVTEVMFVLKVTKSDKIYQIEKSLEL